MAAITPVHDRWREFCDRLEGPEGCDFKPDDQGRTTWRCADRYDKTFATAILTDMGFSAEDIAESVAYFDARGGHCDCEILFNIDVDTYVEDAMVDGTVAIRVYGASDDLVEVVGPCWEYNSEGDYVVQADRGEYDVYGDVSDDRYATFQLSDADRKPLAMVYAVYGRNGGWAFALGGAVSDDAEDPCLPDGITATIAQSDHSAYSAELCIIAPAGTRFDVVPR